jgi:hypothetical protein
LFSVVGRSKLGREVLRNIPRLFFGGSLASSGETGTIFIENGRLHAYTIIGVIKRRLSDKKKTRVVE